MSTSENDFAHVKELGRSNFEIAEGDPDIRGWTVKNEQGNILGEVSDLLFDTEAGRVLYIVLDMEGNELNLKERKVLVPIQMAELHEGYKNVILPGVMANELSSIPEYEKGKLSTKMVDLIVHSFAQRSEPDHEATKPHADVVAAPAEEHPEHQAHKAVIGVYEHINQGQAAVEHLIKGGFSRDHITISNRDADENEGTAFFRSLFKDDNDVHRYSEAAKSGAVVTVDVHSDKEAEDAAEILDQLGAMNMDERNEIREKYNSRILIRQAPPII